MFMLSHVRRMSLFLTWSTLNASTSFFASMYVRYNLVFWMFGSPAVDVVDLQNDDQAIGCAFQVCRERLVRMEPLVEPNEVLGPLHILREEPDLSLVQVAAWHLVFSQGDWRLGLDRLQPCAIED